MYKNRTGYVFKLDGLRNRFIRVFWKLDDLRLHCGEVEARDIEKVDVKKIEKELTK